MCPRISRGALAIISISVHRWWGYHARIKVMIVDSGRVYASAAIKTGMWNTWSLIWKIEMLKLKTPWTVIRSALVQFHQTNWNPDSPPGINKSKSDWEWGRNFPNSLKPSFWKGNLHLIPFYNSSHLFSLYSLSFSLCIYSMLSSIDGNWKHHLNYETSLESCN